MQSVNRVCLSSAKFLFNRAIFQESARCMSISGQLHTKKLTQFHTSKLTQEFDKVLDTNGDGFIDQGDINGLKEKMQQFVQKHYKKDRSEVVSTGMDKYWDLLYEYADTQPKDGRISREEWLSLWSEIASSVQEVNYDLLPDWVKLHADRVFHVMDYNGDDVITVDEYKDFWEKICENNFVSKERIQEYFDHMTENNKHPIDLARFKHLYADFCLSGDPETPGRYMGGPIEHVLSQKGGRQDIQRLRR